jgi:hypothetical protein
MLQYKALDEPLAEREAQAGDAQERAKMFEDNFIELLLINQELLDSLTSVVKRLESLPGAAPMDSVRSAMVHMSDRLHDVLTHYLGEHDRPSFTDFAHPDNQGSEPE